MSTKQPIEKLTIAGFKSIRKLDELRLHNLNVLIGANGAGKSNFVDYFRLLNEMVNKRLQVWTQKQGGADRIVSFGIKETSQLASFVEFGPHGYRFTLEPTSDGGFVFAAEDLFYANAHNGDAWIKLGAGQRESRLDTTSNRFLDGITKADVHSLIADGNVFHFHDTSETAGMKRLGALHDNEYLRSDASNLAAFLYKLAGEHAAVYERIRQVIALAIPFFDDFVFRPQMLPTEESQIRLLWRQKGSDYSLWPSQLSDGSLRFICLATALLQPDPPSTIIIDEPELGLHPHAITLLGALIRSATNRMQVIVSTQSVPLLNEFSLDDLIVVEREAGASIFKRLNQEAFSTWLSDYSIGELWEKNILGGRPSR